MIFIFQEEIPCKSDIKLFYKQFFFLNNQTTLFPDFNKFQIFRIIVRVLPKMNQARFLIHSWEHR